MQKRNFKFSLEIFPPKKDSDIKTIYDTLDELKDLNPDFISVTYGALGSLNNNKTVKIASDIKNQYEIESVAHLTCVGLKKNDCDIILNELKNNNVKNILALRGDLVPGIELGDFKYANELVSYINEFGGFNVFGACYPEGHLEAASLDEDIYNLKNKVDCGVKSLITQLFFDNKHFYKFQKMALEKGITVPIEAGIMPITNKKQIEKMSNTCGASIPDSVQLLLDKYGDNPEQLREEGIKYAVEQIKDLINHGVYGIHLYTMNSPYIAKKIYEQIKHLM